MEFNSLFFILIYLPCYVCTLFFIKDNKKRNVIILLFSLFFYYYGSKPLFFVLVFVSLISYFFGLIVKNNKLLYIVYLFIVLSVLCIFKYHRILFDIFKQYSFGAPLLSLTMPLGISFFTFSSISYVSDIYYDRYDSEYNYFNILSFLVFFPVVISGPLIRYNDYRKFLDSKDITVDTISEGLRRFIIGLTKKVIVANQVALVVTKLFDGNNELNFVLSWYAIFAYAIYSFYDFSGYSDMSIGIGLMSGYKLPENFNDPYFSHSISEYWRRWHMTLGAWFKDYVFIPILGSKTIQKISKCFSNKKTGRIISKIIALSVVWILTGIWHGATLNYVFWGLYSGFFIVLEVLLGNKYKKTKRALRINESSKLWKAFQIIRTNILLIGKNLLARCTNLTQLVFFIKSCVGLNGFVDIISLRQMNILYVLYYMFIGILFLFPAVKDYFNKVKERKPVIYDFSLLLMMFISLCYIACGSYSPFMYFNV